MHCKRRLMKFGSGEGNSAPGIGVGGIEFGGFVEGRQGFIEVLLTNQILPAGDEQFDIIRRLGQESEVKLVGSFELAGLGEDIRKHPGDCRVQRVSGMEFLKQRQSIGVVLCGKDRGELRVQSGIVGRLLECRADEFFGFGIVLVLDENVSKA